MRLSGKNALVTGTSRGIGPAIARALAAEGARVLCHARHEAPAQALAEELGGVAVVGDLSADGLGIKAADRKRLAGVDHVVHLAALYDMTADDERNRQVNVEGTRRVVELAGAVGAKRFHHVSSVAVAGEFSGRFTEAMFAEGQHLPSPYHATKYEAERIVREEAGMPWRVYRPAVVVGFAAETGDEHGSALDYARDKLSRKGCDLLVLNRVDGGRAFEVADNAGVLLAADGTEPVQIPLGPKTVLSGVLCDAIAARLNAARPDTARPDTARPDAARPDAAPADSLAEGPE